MRNGLTPTHLAASNNYLDVCRMITKSLDDQNPTSNKWGSTVLTYSEENDRIDVVDINKVKSRTDICKVHGISCHLNSRSFIKRLKFQILNMRQVSTDSSSSETLNSVIDQIYFVLIIDSAKLNELNQVMIFKFLASFK